jgi:hypothetical protein
MMKWISGQPVDKGYYLCAVVGNSKSRELLYWDGSGWSYLVEWEGPEYIDNNEVPYYMNFDDIPMPEGWVMKCKKCGRWLGDYHDSKCEYRTDSGTNKVTYTQVVDKNVKKYGME